MSYNTVMSNSKVQLDLTVPHVYSVVLTVNNSGSYLYTGVHRSIDDALTAAKAGARQAVGKDHKPFKVDVDMWNAFDGKQILTDLYPSHKQAVESKPTVRQPKVVPSLTSPEECAIRIKAARNRLMKFLVDEKDVKTLPKMRDILTTHQYNYVKGKIGARD